MDRSSDSGLLHAPVGAACSHAQEQHRDVKVKIEILEQRVAITSGVVGPSALQASLQTAKQDLGEEDNPEDTKGYGRGCKDASQREGNDGGSGCHGGGFGDASSSCGGSDQYSRGGCSYQYGRRRLAEAANRTEKIIIWGRRPGFPTALCGGQQAGWWLTSVHQSQGCHGEDRNPDAPGTSFSRCRRLDLQGQETRRSAGSYWKASSGPTIRTSPNPATRRTRVGLLILPTQHISYYPQSRDTRVFLCLRITDYFGIRD